MAAQDSFILDEEELSCPICFEEFNQHDKNRHPKLLLCLHTFCMSCMETLRKYDGSLQCSICRTSHQVYRVTDLMDNYVIFDYLREKQECDDEKLANQLKEEYDASVRILRQQEERDAEFARVEAEKNKEAERLKRERDEVLKRLAEEQLKHEEEKLKLEQVQRKAERRRKIEERKRIAELVLSGEEMRVGEVEENYSSNESSSTQDTSESSSESETESEDSFQDTEVDHNAVEEEPDGTPQPVIDGENYVTLSSDNEHDYLEISSDEEEMGTALSTTAPLNSRNPINSEVGSPTTSPEPDLLSEEFSGVALANAKPSESISKASVVRRPVQPDSSIIILNTSSDECECEAPLDQASQRQYEDVLPFSRQKTHQDEISDNSDVDSGGNDNDWIDVESCSSSEECSTPFNVVASSNTFNAVSNPFGRLEPISIQNANDENCELQ